MSDDVPKVRECHYIWREGVQLPLFPEDPEKVTRVMLAWDDKRGKYKRTNVLEIIYRRREDGREVVVNMGQHLP